MPGVVPRFLATYISYHAVKNIGKGRYKCHFTQIVIG